MNILQAKSAKSNEYNGLYLKKYIGCVVVQGVTNPTYVSEIKRGWDGFQIIFSTWVGTDTSIYEPNDIVILNEYPQNKGVANLGCQKISTQNGMLHAKELGWDRAIKWRSDQWPINGKELIKNFGTDGMNIYAWINDNGGYICDYFMEGRVESIIDLFEVPIDGEFPEKHLTRRFFNRGLDIGAKCIVTDVAGECDIHSGKWNLNLSLYVNNPIYNAIIPNKWHL